MSFPSLLCTFWKTKFTEIYVCLLSADDTVLPLVAIRYSILEPVVVYRGIASVDNYCTLPIAQSFNYQYRKVKIYEEGKENVVIFNYQYGGGNSKKSLLIELI